MKHVKRILGPIVEAKPANEDPKEDISLKEEKAIEEKTKKGRKKKNV